MDFLKRWMITVFCLFAAIACYTFGIPAGGILFLVFGVLLEGIFWTRLFKRKAVKTKRNSEEY